MNDSTSYLLKRLLAINSIKIDEKELEFQYESHPSYPSLHSLTGVLTHFNVSNLAVEVPKDLETLASLPTSFIAHIKNEKGEDFVLTIQSENHIELVYDKKKKETLSREDFLQAWTGIIVAVEKTEDEIHEKGKARFSGNIFYYMASLGLFLLFFWNHPSLFQSVHFLLSLIGVAISVLIVQHEFGISSKSLDRFCSENSKKVSCDEVLNSNGAKLIGNIKFSDVGLLYFTGISLAWLLLSIIENSNDSLIIALSVGAIPFTFYSIYYQYRIVKKWCPLCLSILAVLWAQAMSILFLQIEISFFPMDLYSSLIMSYSFLTVASLWFFLYPKLKLVQEHRKLKVSHYRFKNNFDIFLALISRNPIIETAIEASSEIILGNKNDQALLKITIITNPLCGHCKSAHQAIEQLLKPNLKQLQIRIIFNVNTEDKNSLDAKIAMCLLNIYHTQKEEHAIQALHELYSDMAANKWLEKWNSEENTTYFEELKKEKTWCLHNNINFTPEILINGRSFPGEYDRSDLRNFIEEIIELEQEKAQALTSEPQYAS